MLKLPLFTLLSLAAGYVSPAISQEKAATCLGPQDACTQVAHLFEKYAAAYNQKDAAAVAALYTPDGEFVWEGPTVSGKDALAKFHDGFLKLGSSNMAFRIDLMQVSGDTAWGHGEWSDLGPTGPNNALQQVHGQWGDVFVHTKDGWRFRMVTINLIKSAPPSAEVSPISR